MSDFDALGSTKKKRYRTAERLQAGESGPIGCRSPAPWRANCPTWSFILHDRWGGPIQPFRRFHSGRNDLRRANAHGTGRAFVCGPPAVAVSVTHCARPDVQLMRYLTNCWNAALLISAWTAGCAAAVGLYGAVCGVALGALYGNFGVAPVYALGGALAGAVAGVIVGVYMAVDRMTTAAFLARREPDQTTAPMPSVRTRPADRERPERLPEWVLARRGRLSGL